MALFFYLLLNLQGIAVTGKLSACLGKGIVQFALIFVGMDDSSKKIINYRQISEQNAGKNGNLVYGVNLRT